MDTSVCLESVPIRRTRLGFEYVVLEDVPSPWRDQCWAHLGDLRTRLIVDGVGPSALIQDWRLWIESLSGQSC